MTDDAQVALHRAEHAEPVTICLRCTEAHEQDCLFDLPIVDCADCGARHDEECVGMTDFCWRCHEVEE